ncbi:hypothetical protein E2C01_063643 [Portunus trituberculatus]|uniref:Uncharacterized protein n=1 Tax=Portunus trituberculatus TaxID=210409 RepID=A0A5B7HI65_PORTR|nr:hypothetical protein [Portunus trituberculatus]
MIFKHLVTQGTCPGVSGPAPPVLSSHACIFTPTASPCDKRKFHLPESGLVITASTTQLCSNRLACGGGMGRVLGTAWPLPRRPIAMNGRTREDSNFSQKAAPLSYQRGLGQPARPAPPRPTHAASTLPSWPLLRMNYSPAMTWLGQGQAQRSRGQPTDPHQAPPPQRHSPAAAVMRRLRPAWWRDIMSASELAAPQSRHKTGHRKAAFKWLGVGRCLTL